jgi:hypothetical protein
LSSDSAADLPVSRATPSARALSAETRTM